MLIQISCFIKESKSKKADSIIKLKVKPLNSF